MTPVWRRRDRGIALQGLQHQRLGALGQVREVVAGRVPLLVRARVCVRRKVLRSGIRVGERRVGNGHIGSQGESNERACLTLYASIILFFLSLYLVSEAVMWRRVGPTTSMRCLMTAAAYSAERSPPFLSRAH